MAAPAGRNGGRKSTLPVTDLVRGDVALLAGDDRVPADRRLIQARSLQVEEAALTGESVPTQKRLNPVATGAGIGDRAGMVFGGTLVTYLSATEAQRTNPLSVFRYPWAVTDYGSRTTDHRLSR